MNLQWVPVRGDMPCPVCGSTRWCMVHVSGRKAICPKTPSCEKYTGRNRDEENYLHRLNSTQAKLLKPVLAAVPTVKRADIDFDAVVTSLEQRTSDSHRVGLCNALSKPGYIEPRHTLYYRVTWNGTCWMMPMYEDGEICGIHRRFVDGSKAFVKGSRSGLFIPVGPVPSEIYVCEGFSDTLCSFSAGYWSIGRVSAKTGYELVVRFLRSNSHINRVNIVTDDDKPGMLGASRLHSITSGMLSSDVVKPGDYKDVRAMLDGEAEVRYKAVDIQRCLSEQI